VDSAKGPSAPDQAFVGFGLYHLKPGETAAEAAGDREVILVLVEDDFPRMTYLEETYYHRLNPATGFGVQRMFTEDGTLDATISFSDGDVVLVPRGHHPCAAPYGHDLYYLNIMAGPRRNWRFQNHLDFDWIAQRDA
jgi:5-deoxy-D-glucuronate isomerase